MAKVTRVAVCPACKVGLGSNPNLCVSCGWVKDSRTLSDWFEQPAYVSFQLKNHQELIKNKNKDMLETQVTLEAAFDKYYADLGAEDRQLALDDAYESVRTLHLSKVSPREVKQILEKAKKLGRLAEALDGFYKHGGKPNVRQQVGSVSSKPGDNPWSEEAVD